jgi:hypothetical protein
MSDIPTINTGGIGNIKNNTNQIPNVGIVGNSIVPSLEPPVVTSTPQPLIRSLELPVFQAPDTSLKYPIINVPTQEEFDAAVRAEKKAQEDEKQEKSRGLPDSPPPILPPQIQQVLPQEDKSSEDAILPVNTNLGVPVIEVPIIGEVPIPPKEQVILAGTTATASVAAALIGKSLVEWMVGKMKPIVQQILIRGKKLLNRDLTQYELQLYFTAELDKKNLKLLKKEWKEEKKSQYKKAHDK